MFVKYWRFFVLLLVAVAVYAVVISKKDRVEGKSGQTPADPAITAVVPLPPDTSCCTVELVPTMLELGSEGCIPCEQMIPVMAALREEYPGKIAIEFHDVREDQTMARRYNIRLIPTQIFLTADGEEYFRHEGFLPKEEIEGIFRQMGVNL